MSSCSPCGLPCSNQTCSINSSSFTSLQKLFCKWDGKNCKLWKVPTEEIMKINYCRCIRWISLISYIYIYIQHDNTWYKCGIFQPAMALSPGLLPGPPASFQLSHPVFRKTARCCLTGAWKRGKHNDHHGRTSNSTVFLVLFGSLGNCFNHSIWYKSLRVKVKG